MDATTVSIIRHLFFLLTVFVIMRAFLLPRGLKDKTLYYEFCEARRELTHLVLLDQVNVHSLSFEFFMRYLSDVIHYSDDYNLGTRAFLKCIIRDSKDLAKEKFIYRLLQDVRKQNKEFRDLVNRILVLTIHLFEKNRIVWLILRIRFLYYALKNSRPDSRYTHAADTVKTVRSAQNTCLAT
jgi:hypothetical protein